MKRKKKALAYQAERRSIFELYIEEVAGAIGRITKKSPNPIKREFLKVAHQMTAAEIDGAEERSDEAPARDEGRRARINDGSR